MNYLNYARIAKYAYHDLIRMQGYTNHFIDVNGTQCHVMISADNQIVAFRGTEKSIDDIMTDLDIRVKRDKHNGFAEAYIRVQKEIECLLDPKKPVKFIGHSLGGALAIIAGAWFTGEDKQVITFGAPRVYTKDGAKLYEGSHITHRLENKCDPVPYLPPYSMGFRHVGMTLYLSNNSIVKDPLPIGPAWSLAWSRHSTKIKAHSIDSYIEKLNSFQYT